jgi:hypothetical protein
VSGIKFTWSNKQENPLLIKLDRILATVEWESRYARCFAWSKARIGSDHCPLVLDFGEHGAARPRHFYFEEQWLQQEGFSQMVADKWRDLKAKGGRLTHLINGMGAYKA